MGMASGVAEQHAASFGAAPRNLHRKWWRSRQDDQRYSKSIHKGVNEQDERWVSLRVKNLQKQSRVKKKTRKFNPKRRVPRTVPRAPYNDSSFLMRVRRTGGLAPAPSFVCPSPSFSNLDSVAYKDFLDHEDYGYGSMAGLIRLREDDDGGDRSSDSATVANNFDDVNMCVEQRLDPVSPAQNLEQRLDEMRSLAPPDMDVSQRVTTQDSRMKCLEDENVFLKDRLFLMQQEVNELRKRLQGGQSSNSILQENDDTQSCLGS